MEGGEKECVEENATPLSGAGRATVDSGAPLTGNLTPHLTDIGTPTGDGLDLTVLQDAGLFSHFKVLLFFRYTHEIINNIDVSFY